MKDLLAIALLLVMTLFACQSEQKDFNPPPRPAGNQVDFSNPKVGQQSLYLRYQTLCDDLEGAFEYTGDTLELSVVEMDGKRMLKEAVTPNSPLYKDGLFVDPVFYSLESYGDYALLPDRTNSALFFFYGNDTLRLTPTPDAELEQNGCRLFLESDPFIGNEIGYIHDFDIGPLKIEEKLAVSRVPMILNIDAYLVHDDRHLYLSQTFNPTPLPGPPIEAKNVFGWVLAE